MNRRSTFSLKDIPITKLQLPPKTRPQARLPTSSESSFIPPSIMSDAQALQQSHSQQPTTSMDSFNLNNESSASQAHISCQTITDYFTKFVTAVALPTCTAAATAAVIFKEYVCHYGVPKAIISDQGPSFKNQLMNSLSTLIGFNHILCTPYHPQSNGQVERFNSTFVTQIAKLTDRESNNWDEYLSPIIFAYNTGIHSTTNISPFELTFGRQANLPTNHPPTSFNFPSPHDYYQQLVRHLKLYHAAVKQNVFNRQQQTKSRYDRNRPNPRYDIGTTVLTRLFFNKSKLDPVFSTSPKIVIEQKHPVYFVKDINTNVVSRVHVNDIRPISLPSPHS